MLWVRLCVCLITKKTFYNEAPKEDEPTLLAPLQGFGLPSRLSRFVFFFFFFLQGSSRADTPVYCHQRTDGGKLMFFSYESVGTRQTRPGRCPGQGKNGWMKTEERRNETLLKTAHRPTFRQ